MFTDTPLDEWTEWFAVTHEGRLDYGIKDEAFVRAEVAKRGYYYRAVASRVVTAGPITEVPAEQLT